MLDFLRAADLDIQDVQVEKQRFDLDNLPAELPEPLKQQLVKDLGDKDLLSIRTVHQDSDGRTMTFPFAEESGGTQKLFAFAGPWPDSLEHGRVLFIDEVAIHIAQAGSICCVYKCGYEHIDHEM